jgi:hypothetical protein
MALLRLGVSIILKCKQSFRIFSDQLLLLHFTIPDPSTMAEHVLRTWNKIKETPNYELVAGELLFRR